MSWAQPSLAQLTRGLLQHDGVLTDPCAALLQPGCFHCDGMKMSGYVAIALLLVLFWPLAWLPCMLPECFMVRCHHFSRKTLSCHAAFKAPSSRRFQLMSACHAAQAAASLRLSSRRAGAAAHAHGAASARRAPDTSAAAHTK